MPTERIKLRQDNKGEWRLYAPKGHVIGGPFRGSKWAAIDWGTRFISCWYSWQIELEEKEEKYEE